MIASMYGFARWRKDPSFDGSGRRERFSKWRERKQQDQFAQYQRVALLASAGFRGSKR